MHEPARISDEEAIAQLSEIEPTKLLDLIFNKSKVPTKWGAIDQLEKFMSEQPREFGELTEYGTPGLYSRELFMPTGMLCTSRIHKTCHQFIVSEGSVTVYNTVTDTTELFKAGDHGITMPGTRRVLFIHENCRWTTFHPTSRIAYDFLGLEKPQQQGIFNKIMEDLIEEYYNPLIVNFDEGVFI